MKKYGVSKKKKVVKICLWIKMNVNTTEEIEKVIHAVNFAKKRIERASNE